MPRWSAEVSMPPIGWVGVGSNLAPGESDTWISEQADRVCEWWGDVSAGVRDQVSAILAHAISVREDESVMELLYFPVPEPYAVRVRVIVCQDSPLEEWRAAGIELDPYAGASLGPGVQAVVMRDVGDGEDRAKLISSAFLFESGKETAIVLVEPTTRQAYALMIDGLSWLLSNLEIRRPNGDMFAAHAIDGFKISDEDEWALTDA